MSAAPGVADVFERGLVLAPLGRDGALTAQLFAEAGVSSLICADLAGLVAALQEGAGFALITQDAVRTADLRPLTDWLAAQPSWSDLPLIVVTERGGGPERNPGARRLMEALGNLTLVERPFHPSTLASMARTALRSRRRQYEAGAQLARLERREAALRDSEERFRALADNMPVLAWIAHADGSIFWYNSRWYAYTGTEPAQMEGWGWQAVHDPRTLPEVLLRWRAAVEHGRIFEMVFPLRGADGRMRAFLTRVVPIRDEAGTVVRWFGTNVDIETERQAEAAVRASEERLRFGLAAGRLGSWEVDPRSGTLVCSQLCAASFGAQAGEELSLAGLLERIYPRDRAVQSEACARALRARDDAARDFTVEYRVIWPDRSVHWLEVRGRAVRGAGRVGPITGVSLDITARKLAEAELQAHRGRLEELVAERTGELAAALARLEAEVTERAFTEEQLRQAQKMEAVGNLTGGIAHDFNNLLSGILGSLELLQRRVAERRFEGVERYTGAAITSAQRAAALTQRLLAFSRRQPLDPKRVDANRLVGGMEELLGRTLGRGVRLEMVLSAGLWATLCDPNQLESALLNLAINARDAMRAGGRLTIETANALLDESYAPVQAGEVRAGQYVMISVTDTGTGMSPDVVARAFDPFFTTKPTGEGTGLGLSMLYGFVKQSEGHVRIYSEQGQGTNFKLYLPRNHAPAGEAEDEAEAGVEAARQSLGRTVLVVDDEPAVRMMVVETLEELGYVTLEAGDGVAGLRIVESGVRIDLLVSDVGMPGLNGRQLADAARQTRPALGVLFMTGYAYNAAIGHGEALARGMEIISKPFALEALGRKVRDMIG